jgi:hypothetical protein
MSMESLGGSMPAGRPAVVFANGVTHVFAIGTNGVMLHWSSANGLDWTVPVPLPFPNLPACYPAAIALANGSIHVCTIGPGGPFGAGGPLLHFHSPNGTAWTLPDLSPAAVLPANGNGVAITSPDGTQIDAFAVSPGGIVRFSWNAAGLFIPTPAPPPDPNLPRCVPAAVSSKPNVIDLFVVGQVGDIVRWTGNNTWTRSGLLLPLGISPIGLLQIGLVAISPSPGIIELFAISKAGALINWTIDETGPAPATTAMILPAPGPLSDGLPAAVAVGDHIEVFAIAPPPNPFTGGALLRWRRDGKTWSGPVVIGANLTAGGVGSAAGANRVDAFAFESGGNNSLQHWPAGVAAADHDPWTNWASTQQSTPAGHCRPSTLEELVAIVKSAEEVPGRRVRAVGSSWSFSAIAEAPSAIGFTVETHGLNKVIDYVIGPGVLTSSAPDESLLVHVESGIVINDLMIILDRKNKAPFTLGGSSGQTIVGAISASVQGADIDRGPLTNAVRAIHLVGAGGMQYWIEPDRWRITNRPPLAAKLGPNVQIFYDDDMFDAALVSVGALGIIYSVVFEVTDQYSLVESIGVEPWSTLRPKLQWSTFASSITQFGDVGKDKRFVQVAIDAGNPGDRLCYITTRVEASGGSAHGTGAPGPFDWFCNDQVIGAIVGAWALAPVAVTGVTALILGVLLSNPGTAFLAPLVTTAGTAVTSVGVISAGLLTVLKAGPAGTLGNFVGSILSVDAGFAASAVSAVTLLMQQPGLDIKQDVAHTVMAPPDPSDCAKRGHAVALAFDTQYDDHLKFLDAVMVMLDAQFKLGNVLGGWISLRFCGPSRAILSPQRSARTCLVEATGVTTVKGTQAILDAMETLGASHNATPHWGMFTNISKAQVASSFPRLDTWKSIRSQLTSGGTLQTFDNQFTHDAGLDTPSAGVPMLEQDGWRWCKKCQSMVYGLSGAPGPCAAGGTHDVSSSGNYHFAMNVWSAPGDRNWRWCNKCQGMVNGSGPCPGGGNHIPGTSDYVVLRDGQAAWQKCSKCASLFHPAMHPLLPGAITCPAGGLHTGGGGYWTAFSNLGVRGQTGWMSCGRCRCMIRGGTTCVGGAAHIAGAPKYALPWNDPTAPGEAHWRRCNKCGTLVSGPGVCFVGGAHDLIGSADYTLITPARQGDWRRCQNCLGLWYSGAGGTGVCAASAKGHDPGTSEYFAANV